MALTPGPRRDALTSACPYARPYADARGSSPCGSHLLSRHLLGSRSVAITVGDRRLVPITSRPGHGGRLYLFPPSGQTKTPTVWRQSGSLFLGAARGSAEQRPVGGRIY